jgi:hypothetical protein
MFYPPDLTPDNPTLQMDARATGEESLCFLNGSRVRANGCLFGLSNNFRIVEAASSNKHFEAMSSFGGLEAYGSWFITRSRKPRKICFPQLPQKLRALPL